MPSNAKKSIPAIGHMADKVRAFPWDNTCLGPVADWEAAQLVAVNMVLTSSFPKCLALGPGMIMIYNDAFLPILGSKPDALGRSFSDVWHEAWSDIGPIARKAQAGESTFIEDFELEIARYGFTETAFFTFCYSPLFNENGQVFGFLDTVVETTAKVLTQRRLKDFALALEREVQDRVADRDRMWNLSVDLMLVTHTDGQISTVNPAFRSTLGWTDIDIAERPLHDLILPEEQESFMTRWAASLQTKTPFAVEVQMLCKAGQYAAIEMKGSVHDGNMLLIGRDMTATRKAQAELRKAELALQHVQKMESMGRLTGGVAHDFNNLLQVIAGNLQLLGRDVEGNVRAQKRLENALSGVERGAKLASYLLAFSRKQTLEPRVVRIDAAVIGMDDMLKRTLGEEFDIEFTVGEGLWNTFVDTAQVENALLNLCINARDAMDGVGKLTIEVGNASLDQRYADRHDEVAAGDYVLMAVSDTGCGMSPETLSKAFDPFYTTKPPGKGTGLGLSMVFGFVKQSGGHIKIYSEVGHGTTVKIYLPRSLDPAELIEQAATHPVVGGTETILVVEDDPAVQSTVVETLKELGYRVLKANDASCALPIIESGIPIDVLFTDVIMPGPLKSPELARKAIAIHPELAVLYTSGYTENAIVHGGRLDRGVELLGKPYTREALARRIRHVLANQQQRQRSAAQPLNTTALDVGLITERTGTPRKVLFVEDDPVIAGVTSELIRQLGHDVVVVSSAEEALERLSAETDVLITDITLEGISGIALARMARERWAGIAIIFASGGDQGEALERTTMLRKPYGLKAITDAIDEACQHLPARPCG